MYTCAGDPPGGAGFSTVAESAAPEEVLGLLREYYEVLDPLLHNFEATVGGLDEDRVRVLFNDPLPCDDPAGQAVKLAVAIRDQLQAPLAQWRRRGYELAFTAGLDQGYATLGTIGLAGRTEYAAVGTANRMAPVWQSGRAAVRHVANILGKLGLRSRAQVAAWAVEPGRTS